MRICVFCGSSAGTDPRYREVAAQTGRLLAREGIELVYGGGRVGLMGILADSMLAQGGRVTGIMPRDLVEKELGHQGLTELVIVESLHDRKREMSSRSDGFIALPGGAGTLEEIFEQWTWAQLGIHRKPCAFLDVGGFYDPLGSMVQTMAREGFLAQAHADMLSFSGNIEQILAGFKVYQPPARKWIKAASASPAVAEQAVIRIAAAAIVDASGRTLLVRKTGTSFFMQPGGKIESGESSLDALKRELREELGLELYENEAVSLGNFSAPAANEQASIVDAELYLVRKPFEPRISAEIAQYIWLETVSNRSDLAPLTRDIVLPLLRRME